MNSEKPIGPLSDEELSLIHGIRTSAEPAKLISELLELSEKILQLR